MDATTIINSITQALECAFDKDAAVKRLQGFINHAGNKTLHIKKHRTTYSFYSYDGKDSDYLSKKSPELYRLARKKYCEALITLLEVPEDERADALESVATLLRKFEIGHLNLLRIVYSKKQFHWYSSNFARKKQPETGHPLDDYLVRSKSEQNIGVELLELGIPFHFEERLEIYVFPLVEKLNEKLRSGAFPDWEPPKNLFYYSGGACYWNVPPALSFMNLPGSIWKTYNSKTGKITIYPDFKIMEADGTVKTWEHEGLADDPVYRSNASERVFVMKATRSVDPDDLIETFEYDTNDKQRISHIIHTRILPNVWW